MSLDRSAFFLNFTKTKKKKIRRRTQIFKESLNEEMTPKSAAWYLLIVLSCFSFLNPLSHMKQLFSCYVPV